jgi:hypothetical protein
MLLEVAAEENFNLLLIQMGTFHKLKSVELYIT